MTKSFLASLLAASVCVGGVAVSTASAQEPRCQIILYGKKDFRPGNSGFRVLFTDESDLGQQDFNNKTSSVVVVKGRWRLYERRNFEGESKRFRPGLYADISTEGIRNNQVSSLKCLSDND
jgi:hypothetical protein